MKKKGEKGAERKDCWLQQRLVFVKQTSGWQLYFSFSPCLPHTDHVPTRFLEFLPAKPISVLIDPIT